METIVAYWKQYLYDLHLFSEIVREYHKIYLLFEL